MKKVMIFGASGMAGHMISNYLAEEKSKYEVINIGHRSLMEDKKGEVRYYIDISDIERTEAVISNLRPDVIINCIGILNKTANLDIKNTVYVNTFFPKFLERLGKKYDIKIINLSTDCVFDGKIGMYKEDSFKSEDDIYGLSKGLGEINNDHDLTFRMSIIGPEVKKNGVGLFHWFMNQKNITVKGYTNVYWTGVTTLELARAIDSAIDQNLKGLYHLVPKDTISKCELLLLFKKYFNKRDVEIEKFDDTILIKP